MLDQVEAFVLRRSLALPASVQRFIGGSPAPEPIDPTVAMLLRLQRWRGVTGLSAGTPARTRERIRRSAALTAGPPTPVAAVRPVLVAGRLAARHYVPPGGAAPLLVFFHGGGFVGGDLDSHDEPCRLLCASAGVHVLSVEYALAPEFPFPAALDDARDAVRWAMSHAAALGADPARVALGGDSAGANLAAVVCQSSRGERMPAAQVLIYPVTDQFGAGPSRSLFARHLLLTAEDIAFFRRCYLSGPGVSATDVRHSPLRAPDLSGLPPAVVVTAALDPLRDEGEAYAERLRAAGVPVVSWRAPGMTHAFLNLTSVSAAAHRAALAVADAVRSALAG